MAEKTTNKMGYRLFDGLWFITSQFQPLRLFSFLLPRNFFWLRLFSLIQLFGEIISGTFNEFAAFCRNNSFPEFALFSSISDASSSSDDALTMEAWELVYQGTKRFRRITAVQHLQQKRRKITFIITVFLIVFFFIVMEIYFCFFKIDSHLAQSSTS